MRHGTVETLITHSGSFHADDRLAFSALSLLYPKARLLRTRDAQVISAANGKAIVFDVGFREAPESQWNSAPSPPSSQQSRRKLP